MEIVMVNAKIPKLKSVMNMNQTFAHQDLLYVRQPQWCINALKDNVEQLMMENMTVNMHVKLIVKNHAQIVATKVQVNAKILKIKPVMK